MKKCEYEGPDDNLEEKTENKVGEKYITFKIPPIILTSGTSTIKRELQNQNTIGTNEENLERRLNEKMEENNFDSVPVLRRSTRIRKPVVRLNL